uniref:Uncharacterized protein n=1 Tax=Sphaerodactylus townsendi TaxID=933632 RepID=A0ACB8F5L0_9SAUR
MNAAKVDNQCQTAARIVTDLCRKKTLPKLDLDTCKEFLLFSPDLSVPEPEQPNDLLFPAYYKQCPDLDNLPAYEFQVGFATC